MPDFNKAWSVASVFNVYGMNRYSTAEMLSDAHRRSRQLRWLDNQSTQVASVADCIRSLGYTVKCCWTEESGRYVIWSIQNDTGFCYGSRGSEIYNHCPFEHQQSFRYLASHRTIYEKVDNKQLKPRTRHLTQGTVYMPARRLRDLWRGRLENISGEIPWPEMKDLIDNGCISNMYRSTVTSSYVEGVSTLGNTLPPDIVEALKSFHSDDANFNKEPDYEFYIPVSMRELHMELPPACPVSEDSGGGAAQGSPAAAAAPAPVAAAQVAAATPSTNNPSNNPSKNTSSSSDSSDSSDSEDD
jgi:hypothetical protein